MPGDVNEDLFNSFLLISEQKKLIVTFKMCLFVEHIASKGTIVSRAYG